MSASYSGVVVVVLEPLKSSFLITSVIILYRNIYAFVKPEKPQSHTKLQDHKHIEINWLNSAEFSGIFIII